VLYRLKDKISRIRFATKCNAVLTSSPVLFDPTSSVALISQLQHKDVLMYLVAVKSFTAQVVPAAVFVLNDGSLTSADCALLKAHIPGIRFVELVEYRTPLCPQGGCWERLLAVASLVNDYYVIQLDSDTVTVREIEEVRRCVLEQSSFALGTWDNQRFETMHERCEVAKRLKRDDNSHVQLVAEANFEKLRNYSSLRYVRGCAGFGGFARRSFTKGFVEDISQEMTSAIGGKWAEWGSEQVMSNIVLANVTNSIVLPHPKYADCQKMRRGETAFIHFIGSCRFSGNTYATAARHAIQELASSRGTASAGWPRQG